MHTPTSTRLLSRTVFRALLMGAALLTSSAGPSNAYWILDGIPSQVTHR